MENQHKQNDENDLNSSASLDSLDSQTTIVSSDEVTLDNNLENTHENSASRPKKRIHVPHSLGDKFNIYLLLFVLMIMLVVMITVISYIRNKQASKQQNTVNTQPLSQEDLEKLRTNDVKVGDPKQILSVESNAVFAGRVLIRDSLEVAGPIKVGGTLNLPGITVSGTSNFDRIQASNLQISGNSTIQGQVNIQNNLTVSGSGCFGGTLTAARLNIETLQVNGNLLINRHIDAGGGTPSKTDGSALGGGGTSSISGTDTAGTVAINIGGDGGIGCFVTINFTQRFSGTPHVIITPVGSTAGGLDWYINRTATNFSICTSSPVPGGQSFAFDYTAID